MVCLVVIELLLGIGEALTKGAIACQLDDAGVHLAFATEVSSHQRLSDQLLNGADGECLARTCLAVGEHGTNTAAPGPWDEGFHQILVDLLGRILRPICAVQGNRSCLLPLGLLFKL